MPHQILADQLTLSQPVRRGGILCPAHFYSPLKIFGSSAIPDVVTSTSSNAIRYPSNCMEALSPGLKIYCQGISPGPFVISFFYLYLPILIGTGY